LLGTICWIPIQIIDCLESAIELVGIDRLVSLSPGDCPIETRVELARSIGGAPTDIDWLDPHEERMEK